MPLLLDQLEGLVARAFHHHRTRLAELVRLPQQRDVLSFQLRHPPIEIAYGKREVVDGLTSGGS